MKLKTLLVFLIFLSSCQSEHSHDKEYPRHVGDFSMDTKLDDPNFKPCHEDLIYQYYNFGNNIQYDGEKRAITDAFKTQYLKGDVKGEDGYIIVRFIVNCEGKAGRFRVQQIDKEYKDKTFEESIPRQILAITKSLDGWKTGEYEKRIYDYYQYLTFKIIDSEIVDILP